MDHTPPSSLQTTLLPPPSIGNILPLLRANPVNNKKQTRGGMTFARRFLAIDGERGPGTLHKGALRAGRKKPAQGRLRSRKV